MLGDVILVVTAYDSDRTDSDNARLEYRLVGDGGNFTVSRSEYSSQFKVDAF